MAGFNTDIGSLDELFIPTVYLQQYHHHYAIGIQLLTRVDGN